jgi:anthraniloyl-CoA monooxygenase
LRAPDDEAGLPAAFARLATLVAGAPVLVAVHGGTAFTRTLVCEWARMRDRVPALLCDPATGSDAGADPEADRDRALTAVLSGRADLVGVAP